MDYRRSVRAGAIPGRQALPTRATATAPSAEATLVFPPTPSSSTQVVKTSAEQRLAKAARAAGAHAARQAGTTSLPAAVRPELSHRHRPILAHGVGRSRSIRGPTGTTAASVALPGPDSSI